MNNFSPKYIILISMDAVSPQRLSCYGYPGKTTPQIDQALIEGGAIFSQAFSQAPFTVPSHASMLTSLYPLTHGVIDYRRKLTKALTLAEVFQKQGFATAGFTNHPCLSNNFGFGRGFDTFFTGWRNGYLNFIKDYRFLSKIIQELVERGARRIRPLTNQNKLEISAEYSLSWIKAQKNRPFFLFIHLFSGHPAFSAPAPFGGLFLPKQPKGFPEIRSPAKQRSYIQQMHNYSAQEKSRLLECLGSLHDEELAYIDHQIGAIITALKKSRLYQDSLIVITSDHGNFLPKTSHPDATHCLLDSYLHVPLLILSPYLATLHNIGCLAQVIDIFPTLLSFCNIDLPQQLQGRDFKNNILNPAAEPPHHYIWANHASQNSSFTALRCKEWKFIHEETAGCSWLFRLTQDRQELYDLSEKFPEKKAFFMQEYLSWRKKVLEYRLNNEQATLHNAQATQLRALGYID